MLDSAHKVCRIDLQAKVKPAGEARVTHHPRLRRAQVRWLGSAGAIPLLEPDRLTRCVQSKDLPTGLVVGHSGTVIVAEAAEGVGLGGDDRGRCERTDARLAPDKREPLAASVAAVKKLCLRLQRGCGVRGWGRDGLGTEAQGRARGRGRL
jgi:hypothetical protein